MGRRKLDCLKCEHSTCEDCTERACACEACVPVTSRIVITAHIWNRFKDARLFKEIPIIQQALKFVNNYKPESVLTVMGLRKQAGDLLTMFDAWSLVSYVDIPSRFIEDNAPRTPEMTRELKVIMNGYGRKH